MGWDTNIIIIAEGSQAEAFFCADYIYRQDAVHYTDSENPYRALLSGNSQTGFRLYIDYKRRKYLPHWIFTGLAALRRDVELTILASCPEFLAGPAGLLRIKAGSIRDSYGITGIRQRWLETPQPDFLTAWFGKDGREEPLRMAWVDDYPCRWVEENYSDYIIPIDDPPQNPAEALTGFPFQEWVPVELNKV